MYVSFWMVSPVFICRSGWQPLTFMEQRWGVQQCEECCLNHCGCGLAVHQEWKDQVRIRTRSMLEQIASTGMFVTFWNKMEWCLDSGEVECCAEWVQKCPGMKKRLRGRLKSPKCILKSLLKIERIDAWEGQQNHLKSKNKLNYLYLLIQLFLLSFYHFQMQVFLMLWKQRAAWKAEHWVR